MNHDLVIAGLIEKKAIHENTELQIKVKRESHKVLVKTITHDPIVLFCASIIDGSTINVGPKDIERIDGMVIDRIAGLYYINLDGSKGTPRKRTKKTKPKVVKKQPIKDVFITLPSGFVISEREQAEILKRYSKD